MKPTTPPNRLSAFAVTAPGLETLCASELADLGIRALPEEGGVAWKGSLESIALANLWLRTASRVLVRVAEFKATAFFELELNAKQIPWKRFVAANSEVEFRVTCHKSKLYHSDAVAQRFATAVEWNVKGAKATRSKASDDDESLPPGDRQLFIVRFVRDVCTVSVDSSGALLHLRGYRQQLAKAPLRETLAAGVLLGSGWTGDTPLVDPMCGAGTIPIEAALIARHMAPGRARTFAFQRWPETDATMWASLLDAARAGELPKSPVAIAGSDRDDGAIAASRANAERAGVSGDVDFSVQPISALTPADPPGLIASNPPYGVRIGDTTGLRNLYAQLGNVARRQRPGWELALLSADRPLEQQTKLAFEERFRTRNGGIPVHLVVARVPAVPAGKQSTGAST
ncbi:MAG: methylase [Gemmatimonadetes bacterium]|nr:methylase [Gemmatimonadota bacterium]